VLLSDKERANLITGDKLVTAGKGASPDGKGKGKDKGPGGPPGPNKAPPGAAPKGNGNGAAPGGFSAEDRQKQTEKFMKATPEERKQMLEQVPAEYRDKAREALKAQGLKIAD
jgi:hypothetical protein